MKLESIELDPEDLFLAIEVLAVMLVDMKHNYDRCARLVPDHHAELIIMLLKFVAHRNSANAASTPPEPEVHIGSEVLDILAKLKAGL